MLSAISLTSKTLLTSYHAFALPKGRDNSQFDVVLGMATHLRIPWDHKLFMAVVFYKNIFCYEAASSSCSVVNLKVPNFLIYTMLFLK